MPSTAILAVTDPGSTKSSAVEVVVRLTFGVVLLSWIKVCIPPGPIAAISASMVVI